MRDGTNSAVATQICGLSVAFRLSGKLTCGVIGPGPGMGRGMGWVPPRTK